MARVYVFDIEGGRRAAVIENTITLTCENHPGGDDENHFSEAVQEFLDELAAFLTKESKGSSR